MVTLEQLLSRAGDELHYTGSGPCKRTVGPRGGVTEHVVRVRPNGRVKTWKTRPGQFSAPYKYGIRARDQFRISEREASDYHVAAECPLGGK